MITSAQIKTKSTQALSSEGTSFLHSNEKEEDFKPMDTAQAVKMRRGDKRVDNNGTIDTNEQTITRHQKASHSFSKIPIHSKAGLVQTNETPFIQRKYEEEEEQRIQRKPLNAHITPDTKNKKEAEVPSLNPLLSDDITASNGGGTYIDDNKQSYISNKFGVDFSNVKIHTDNEVVQINRELNVKAFTTDNDIGQQPVIRGHTLPFFDIIQRSFGHHDISHIQSYTDGKAAAEAFSLGADAFTRGINVSFLRTPNLHLAAHEAAHVVQQCAGVSYNDDIYERHADQVADNVVQGKSSELLLSSLPRTTASSPGINQNFNSGIGNLALHSPVIQMKRIPPNIRALLTAVGGGSGANFHAHSEGVFRLIDLAMEELTTVERNRVHIRRLGGLTDAQFDALPRLERRSRYAEAILAEFPALQLGDPNLLDVLPRAGFPDVANIAKVVTHTNAIFDDIGSGARDPWLIQVFGSANLGTAKTNYALAKARMNVLHGSNHIVTDRGSGFSDEAEEGGLTGPDQISVNPSTIDDPDNIDSRITMLHESMHAGNPAIEDDIYADAVGFIDQPDAKKLVNAAHYEVVPWRIFWASLSSLQQPLAFPHTPITTPPTFETFAPAGTVVGGVATPARTPAVQGSVDAYELVNGAWALGLNLHRIYVQLFRTPTNWTTPQFGGSVHFNNSVPFWSKVQKLTIHLKTTIDPASADPAKLPVSQIDIALSEGMTRRLALTMDVLNKLKTDAIILAFETANATPAELSAAFPGGAHTSAATERDFLLKLALRHPSVQSVTGRLSRDLRVIRLMADPSMHLWNDILRPRNPSSFAD